jgi:hypothetical protein
MTIAGVRETPKGARLFCHNEESKAWDVAFATKDKEGRTPYIQIPCPNTFGKRTAMLRQYVMACGGDPEDGHAGKKIVLYPVDSKKSQTGQAIRIAIPEGLA